MTITSLTLGDFTFARFEVPEHINFGGEQRLNVHELVGGVRVIDALGQSPAPIQWSGVFVGNSAVDRAFYLDGLRKSGKQLILAWDKLLFNVVIRSFTPDYRFISRISYSIVCEVVSDLTQPITSIAKPSLDQLVADDAETATGLASGIGDSKLSGLMAALNSTIKSVSSFAKATQGTLNTVLVPIAAVRSQVNVLVQSTNGVIRNVTTLGGILPNNPIAKNALNLTNQVNAVNTSQKLFNLDRVLGRMSNNISSIRK